MPENIKQFEAALKSIGLDPDKDVDTLTFASFRAGKQGVKTVGVAAGPFNMKAVLKKMKLQKYVPKKYNNSEIYPMDGGFVMSFLDDSTLLFGDSTSIRVALDTRDGTVLGLDTNGDMADMMSNVDSAPVWSILDQQGTQNMMHSAMGDASKVADYETIKKHLVGSRYTMNFISGVNFDLTVVTSDSVTAGTMSSLVKAGILFKKMSATPAEKIACGKHHGRLRRLERPGTLQGQRPAVPVADALGPVRGSHTLRLARTNKALRRRNAADSVPILLAHQVFAHQAGRSISRQPR